MFSSSLLLLRFKGSQPLAQALYNSGLLLETTRRLVSQLRNDGSKQADFPGLTLRAAKEGSDLTT